MSLVSSDHARVIPVWPEVLFVYRSVEDGTQKLAVTVIHGSDSSQSAEPKQVDALQVEPTGQNLRNIEIELRRMTPGLDRRTLPGIVKDEELPERLLSIKGKRVEEYAEVNG